VANYNIDFSTPAVEDLNEITQYLDGQRSGLGFEFSFEVTLLLERLRHNPRIYQQVAEAIFRGLLGKFNYLVFYTIEGSTVTILAQWL